MTEKRKGVPQKCLSLQKFFTFTKHDSCEKILNKQIIAWKVSFKEDMLTGRKTDCSVNTVRDSFPTEMALFKDATVGCSVNWVLLKKQEVIIPFSKRSLFFAYEKFIGYSEI